MDKTSIKIIFALMQNNALNIDIDKLNLPAAEIVSKVNSALCQHNTLIITAPPGAGKSTLLPLTMLDAMPEGCSKILMLEPRRLAARQIAGRMAEIVGEDVGQTIGYRIRFESKVTQNTQIEVLTEGILTRILQSDNELKDVGIVVFDEFHERSLFADVALALCRECQQILRPDLRIVIMSATIDCTTLSAKLDAPIIESRGKMFPVDIRRTDECDALSCAQMVAHVIREAHKTEKGDILAFLPGEAEIRQCETLLGGALGTTRIMPLYGMLPQQEQRAAIMPDRNGLRKVVLATPIAETSLNIEGVRIVVDSGLCRTLRFDPNSGLSRLETMRISMDMADQRAGRAGRLTDGVCYRLWSLATEHRMKPHREPEIEQADLAQLVLDLAVWGENKPENLTWLTPPPKAHIVQARELLEMLDAIDVNGYITPHGRELNALPCHPRIAQMLLCAKNNSDKALATDIAALLEERDPMGREAGIDINLRIDALRRNRREHRGNRQFDRSEKIAAQYRKMLHIEQDNEAFDRYTTGYLIAAAYPERIASEHAGNNAQFLLSNGSLAQTEHTDDLAHEQWLAIAHLNARDGIGRIFLASPLDPTDLRDRVRERDNISWNTKKGCLIAQRELRIGRLVLSSKPINNIDTEIIKSTILEAVKKDGLQMLNFDETTEDMQNRILSLRRWHSDDFMPDVSTSTLLATPEKWLAPYIGKATTTNELKKIDLAEAIFYSLSYEQQQLLERLAPQQVKVPSGSEIRLKYQSNGNDPVLAVRLQECFGLAETPTVDDGRHKVLMHLLSPGFKPVQVTQDLRSFWDNAYFDVKKELKSRYPKHVWPDKPWEEPAIRGVKRRNN